MVAGSRGDGAAKQYKLSSKTQATINSVREIVGAHSEAEILAVLRETNMDPNETVQRLLYQDPFHEVKRRRDKKKENTGLKDSTQPKAHADPSVQPAKAHKPVSQSTRGGSLARNRSPDARFGREFRVVRDNRENQNVDWALKPEIPYRSVPSNERGGTTLREKSSLGDEHPTTPEGKQPGERIHGADSDSLLPGKKAIELGSSSGVYASSSDPVHVPSLDARSAGIVGAIRREVGVVGGRRYSSERPVSLSSTGKDISSKIGQQNQVFSSDSVLPVGRPFSSHQYHSKFHPQSVGHQKAAQPNMEWRPKSSQKSSNTEGNAVETNPALSAADSSANAEVAALSDRLAEANILESRHVIIPQHLRVPETERAGLTFGSFGVDSSKEGSNSASASISDQTELGDEQGEVSQALSLSSAQSDVASLGNTGNFADVGLVQSQEVQQMENPPALPSFSEAYDPRHSYEVQFFEDGVHGQRLSSPAEALGAHMGMSSPVPSGAAMAQHQAFAAQQAMLYPQVHLSHYPNFVPYRQILSPMYVPPMAIPSYSSGPAYPHPSSASSYLLMPGGNSHLAAGSIKYAAASQYKPLPAAYGNYAVDDVGRVKYKDSNPYVPSPQADGSEIWIQSQRDLPGMHSAAAPFYNLSGQATHAAAYLPAPAPAPSSHVQFPGVYHQPATLASPHHLVPPAVGGGVGVAAPPPQVGSYQQQQVGHINWTGNF